MDLKVPGQNSLRKIFGIGPAGAAISFILLALFWWAASMIGLPVLAGDTNFIKITCIILIIMGFLLHFWSFSTLRSWWADDKLCTSGPFKYFRHPMYAAWITFICPGMALYLNSWLYFFWVLSLHLLWHQLVKKEEIMMINTFGDTYKNYAKGTGRIFPKVWNHSIKD